MTDSAASGTVGRAGATAPGPSVRPPTRPTWNPVEEARKRAELAMAAAAANGGGGTATARPGGSKVPHHTATPRLMVLLSLILVVVAAFVNDLLIWVGEAESVRDRVEFTPLGRLVSIGVRGGSTGAYMAGWVWWTAAAGANARHKTPNAGSAILAPLVHAGVFTLIGVVTYLAESSGRWKAGMLSLVLLGAWMAAYFCVLLLFRRKAEAIKAPALPWTRLMALPFAMILLVGFFVGVAIDVKSPAIAIVGLIVGLVLALWYLVSVASAMKSFDEACRTPSFARGDGEVPDFMRMALGR